MTSATSPSNVARRFGARGFSLVELLVVIGIIVVLAGIALPALIKAYSAAEKTKGRSDLNTIGIGLEAYKSIYGDYPRTNGVQNTGAAVLTKALIGPGDAVNYNIAHSMATIYNPGDVAADTGSGITYICFKTTTATTAVTDTNYWAAFPDGDGQDGLGWRVRAGMGKVQEPLINLDRLKLKNRLLANKDGYIILYYPANPVMQRTDKKPGDLTAAPEPTGGTYGGYVGPTPAAGQPFPFYNSSDNAGLMHVKSLRVLLGDYNLDGACAVTFGETEKPNATLPFLLINPGPDGTYGPAQLAGSYTGNDETNSNTWTTPASAPAPTTANQWNRNKRVSIGCDDITNIPQ